MITIICLILVLAYEKTDEFSLFFLGILMVDSELTKFVLDLIFR